MDAIILISIPFKPESTSAPNPGDGNKPRHLTVSIPFLLLSAYTLHYSVQHITWYVEFFTQESI